MGVMKKMMFQLLSLAALIVAVVLVVQNFGEYVPLRFLNLSMEAVPLGILLLVAVLMGSATIFFRMLDIAMHLQGRLKQFEHRREKAEVSAQTSSDQVNALEAKIETLEKALERALAAQSKSSQ